MKDHFAMFARYNEWANRRIYEAAQALSDADYRADTGAFFKSMHGTLNHVLVADRIWLNRFTGTGPHPKSLDEILFEDFPALKEAREAEDTRIVRFADGLGEAALKGSFTYTPITRPQPVTQPLGPALAHFFNHQTHHRGHAHMILTVLTGDAPPLDLVYFQRETGIGLQ
ncbi:MAG: DinB family protein [Flavobacteriaceae bacterium]